MTPLTIGIDARELLGATTGVGRYLGELLGRWTAADASRHEFVLYAPEALAMPFGSASIRQRTGGPGRGTWWEQTWLRQAVRADRPDVFFAPAYTAPLGPGAPLAVTIHDISFEAHPEWFRPRERVRRRWLTRRTAHAAATIFTDSQFSHDEIVSRLGVAAERIHVIPPGVTSRHGRARPAAARDPMVLFAGSLFNRRRIPDLIAAFAAAARELPQARLVIVGDDRTWPSLDFAAIARSHGVFDRTELRRYVAEPELEELYGRASVFAFLSEYEGFGLTPLEALTASVPIVVLDTAIAREVYGPAATYVTRGDIEGTATAIRQLLTSPEAAAAQLARARNTLDRYSWDTAAAATLEHLEDRAAMTTAPTLSIVIVSYNARADLENCLRSLADAPPALPHGIVVVDNASTEPGIADLPARWPGIRLIQLPGNRGFAAANNVGINASTGELLLLLNSDTIVPPGAIDTLAARLLASERIGAAGPRLVDGAARVELSFGAMLSPVAELRQKIVGRLHARGSAAGWVERATSRERTVDWVSGACLLVRRKAAVEAGLLDERFFLYTEDVDFCASLRRCGWQVLFTPAAEVIHLRGRSRASASAAAQAAYRRSHLAFYEKHHPRWAPVLRAYLRLRGQLPGQASLPVESEQ